MYTLEYSPTAYQNLLDIARYIGVVLENPIASDRLADKFVSSAENIINMPYICPLYTPIYDLDYEYRKLIVDNYIIFYCIDEEHKIITIMYVVYGGSDYEHILK